MALVILRPFFGRRIPTLPTNCRRTRWRKRECQNRPRSVSGKAAPVVYGRI